MSLSVIWLGEMYWIMLPLGLFKIVIEWKCEGGLGGMVPVNMI